MNTKENAIKSIFDFLQSEEKSMLLTGTHQFIKHELVLETIINHVAAKSDILFRVNSMKHLGSILEDFNSNYQTGVAYIAGKHHIYFDSFNKTSWKNTSYEYDLAIVYPIDSILRNNNKKEVLQDLFDVRDINKIFLISWTDNPAYDFRTLSDYYDRHAVYDAEEEDPDYHKRVLNRF